MCWKTPPPGENTVTLVTRGFMKEIPVSDLQPGDAIGLCGPGTAGDDGHIQLFDGWTTNGLHIWEQAGGVNGPVRREIKRITPGYKAYRYVAITPTPPVPPLPPIEEDDVQPTIFCRMNGVYYRVPLGGQIAVVGDAAAMAGQGWWWSGRQTNASHAPGGDVFKPIYSTVVGSISLPNEPWVTVFDVDPTFFGYFASDSDGGSSAGPVDLTPAAIAAVADAVVDEEAGRLTD